MPRIRTIKPEFWTSEQVAGLSLRARLLFIGMWNFCDDGGIHPASPMRLRLQIFPADPLDNEAVADAVAELHAAGLLTTYTVGGRSYWRVTNWHRHQRIDRPTYTHPDPENPKAPPPPAPLPLLAELEEEPAAATMANATAPKIGTETESTPNGAKPLARTTATPSTDEAPKCGRIVAFKAEDLPNRGALDEASTSTRDGMEGKGKEEYPPNPQGGTGGSISALQEESEAHKTTPASKPRQPRQRRNAAREPVKHPEAVARLLKTFCDLWPLANGQEAAMANVQAAIRLTETYGPSACDLVPAVTKRLRRHFRDCQTLAGAAKHFTAAAAEVQEQQRQEAARLAQQTTAEQKRNAQIRAAATRRQRLETQRKQWEELPPTERDQRLAAVRREFPALASRSILETVAIERLTTT